jgi:hypothetical protein
MNAYFEHKIFHEIPADIPCPTWFAVVSAIVVAALIAYMVYVIIKTK